VEKGSRRSSTTGCRGMGMAWPQGVATCSSERSMAQGGAAVRRVGERRVAPSRGPICVTHKSLGAAHGPLVAGVHVRRGTIVGRCRAHVRVAAPKQFGLARLTKSISKILN
jgi:hypothetical protein